MEKERKPRDSMCSPGVGVGAGAKQPEPSPVLPAQQAGPGDRLSMCVPGQFPSSHHKLCSPIHRCVQGTQQAPHKCQLAG